MSRRCERRTRIRPIPKTDTGGRSCSASGSAGTTGRTTGSRPGWCGSTTSSVRSGTYDGGREKSPAAICRKVALARDGGEIEVWGDGSQTRSYCYVDDAVEGMRRLIHSSHRDPLNLGQERLISINELVDLVARSPASASRGDTSGRAGCPGPDERQHATARGTGLGAGRVARRGHAADVRVDRRPTRGPGRGAPAPSRAPAVAPLR